MPSKIVPVPDAIVDQSADLSASTAGQAVVKDDQKSKPVKVDQPHAMDDKKIKSLTPVADIEEKISALRTTFAHLRKSE